MSLTLSSTLSPFPYAAAALAVYTKQAELIFDDAAVDVTLDLNGTVVSGEEKIIEELAKVGGLSSDSTTVWPGGWAVPVVRLILRFRLRPSSYRQGHLRKQPLIQKLSPLWMSSITAWLTELSWLAMTSVLQTLYSGPL